MPDRVIKRHDTAQQPQVRLLDETGAEITLTGATVTYTLTNIETGVVKVNRGTAVLRDQGTNTGEVYYQLVSGDVDTVGLYQEEWEVVYSGGARETFPVGAVQVVRIEADADNT
jgi:hypothetical protein